MKLYTVRQVMGHLRASQATVLHWINTGQLRAMNVARLASGKPRWRVSEEALEEFVAERSNKDDEVPRQSTGET